MKQTVSNRNFKIKKLQFRAYDFFRVGILLVLFAFIGIGVFANIELSVNVKNWLSYFIVGWMFFGVFSLILSFSFLSSAMIMQRALKEQVEEIKSFKLFKEKRKLPKI